ncbi:MAG: hypothetical protein IPJ98_26385 [Bryobacterales bacterium]|nr:hypothetical protein [Bryobacterales bacterium]
MAATLLLAPDSGVGTRKLIGRKFKEGEDWIKNKATRRKAAFAPAARISWIARRKWAT